METGKSAVIVTRATPEDRATIQTLDATMTGNEERLAFLAHAVAAGQCAVARVAEEIAGFAVCAPTFFEQWFIELVFVHPAHRRRGIATALIERCESVCPTGKLFTSTNESNTAMQAVLKKRGYTRSGYIENLDEDDPELIYLKRLPHREP